jgi:hypothetical protein
VGLQERGRGVLAWGQGALRLRQLPRRLALGPRHIKPAHARQGRDELRVSPLGMQRARARA